MYGDPMQRRRILGGMMSGPMAGGQRVNVGLGQASPLQAPAAPAAGGPFSGLGGALNTGGGAAWKQQKQTPASTATSEIGGDLPASAGPGAGNPYPGADPYWGNGKGGAKGTRKALMRLGAGNAFWSNPYWRDSITQLMQQANTNRMDPSQAGSFLAPRLEALNDSMDLARGNLDRSLAARGLESSSGSVGASEALELSGGAQRAGMINGLRDLEDQRQQSAQAQLRAILGGMMGQGAAMGSGIAGQIASENLQREMMDQQGGFDFGDLFSGLGGMAGLMMGGGAFGLGTGGGTRREPWRGLHPSQWPGMA